MGHIAHLKKFQSMNTITQNYGFTIMLFTREKTQYLIFWEFNDPYLYKLTSHSPMDAFCQVWFNLAMCFWRSRLLNSVTEFTLFHYHLPLKKGLAVHLNKLELPSSSWILPLKKGMSLHLFKLQFPSPKNALCKV